MENELIEYLKYKAENDALSVVNIKDGAAVELIDFEIQRVLDNIDDPNTTDSERKVIFELKFKPNKERTITEITFGAKSNLAGSQSHVIAARISTGTDGRPYAEELNRQKPMPFGNVTKIKKGGSDD